MFNPVISFSTSVWHSNFNTNLINTINSCLEIQKTFPSEKKSNVGGYQSPLIFEEDFLRYFPDIASLLAQHMMDLGNKLGVEFGFGVAWININQKNSFNQAHIHKECLFSGVLYLSVNPETGRIYFTNPTPARYFSDCDFISGFEDAQYLEPKNGDFLVFPSYLQHYVAPNQSDAVRISMAFNFSIQKQPNNI